MKGKQCLPKVKFLFSMFKYDKSNSFPLISMEYEIKKKCSENLFVSHIGYSINNYLARGFLHFYVGL